jgi:hypothetical protein
MTTSRPIQPPSASVPQVPDPDRGLWPCLRIQFLACTVMDVKHDDISVFAYLGVNRGQAISTPCATSHA